MRTVTPLPAGITTELEWWLVKWATFSDYEIESMYNNKKAQAIAYIAECKAENKEPGNYGHAIKQMFVLLNAEMQKRGLLK